MVLRGRNHSSASAYLLAGIRYLPPLWALYTITPAHANTLIQADSLNLFQMKLHVIVAFNQILPF